MSPHLPITPWLGIWHFVLEELYIGFCQPHHMADCLNVSEMLPDLCIMIEGNALSCTKKFKGNFHLSLKRKSYHHTKYIWHVVAISVICTAIGNVNILLVNGVKYQTGLLPATLVVTTLQWGDCSIREFQSEMEYTFLVIINMEHDALHIYDNMSLWPMIPFIIHPH